MLYQQTIEKLHALKLTGFVEALEEQRRAPSVAGLPFEERLGFLVERQWLWRENCSLQGRLRMARMKTQACIEDLDYRASRGLSRDTLEQMAAAEWVANRRCCLVTGPAGSGKTYLACALAQQACRDGFRALYFQAQKLFRELAAARCNGSLSTMLGRITRAHLLVVDDLGLEKAGPDDYRDLLELIDDRHGSGATLFTSQYPVSAWHELVGNPTIADALLDRLVHGAYRIELLGESMRKIRHKETTVTVQSSKRSAG